MPAANTRVVEISSQRPIAFLLSADPNLASAMCAPIEDELDGTLTVLPSFDDFHEARLDRAGSVLLVDLQSLKPDELKDWLGQWGAKAASESALVVIADKDDGIPIELAVMLEAIAAEIIPRSSLLRQLSNVVVRQANRAVGPRLHRPAEPRVFRGQSVEMKTWQPELFGVLEELELAAAHDVTLLIVGETGSGKTTLAKLVHERSPHAEYKFMHLACGALPPTLIESELFGHARGAFTGADRNKIGRFEAVGRGTLLLDEIDTLSLEEQAKLLRVIETGQFEQVGSTETRKMEARLIVASNVSLEQLVASDRFRKDLFYRLNVMRFELPPLRRRQNDIVPMAIEFIADVTERCKIDIRRLHPQFLSAIKTYSWPGNIRELKNCIERAVILCRERVLSPNSLPAAIAGYLPSSAAPASAFGEENQVSLHQEGSMLGRAVSSSEQLLIAESLRRNKFKRAAVARELGISRVTLYNKMRKYGLL